MDAPSPYLDTREAAGHLRLSKSSLDKLRGAGGGPPYLKLGRRVVYARADLDAWVNERRRERVGEGGDPLAGGADHA